MTKDSIYAEFWGLEQDLRERIRAYLEPMGINHLCFLYLIYIDAHNGCRVSEVAHAAGMDKASVTRALSSLGRLGFVDRQIGKLDTRAFDLYLTPAGKTVVARIRRLRDEWEKDIREGLSEEERSALTKLLRKAREHFAANRAQNAAAAFDKKSPAFFL